MKKIILIAMLCLAFAAAVGVPAFYATAAAKHTEPVMLELTYPAGKSPKVFTKGWVFGASCIVNPGTRKQKDISRQVKWSGTGTFTSSTGKLSRPVFTNAGSNTIQLSVKVGKNTITKKFYVMAVSPTNYAHVGTIAYCAADSHGNPCCPHEVAGPIITGSPTVKINGMPAARVGDKGKHYGTHQCCGPNTFTVASGDPKVLIDGKRAARIGDTSKHCGGMGVIGVELIPKVPTTPTTTTTVPPQKGAWDGIWKTNWGTIVMVQSGDSVTGDTDLYDGKIKGTVSGNNLKGKWSNAPSYSEPEHAGVIDFTLSSDGKSFTSTKSSEYGEWYGMWGPWNGTKQ